jgi:hypothetical protein
MNTFWNQIFGARIPTVIYCEQALDFVIARPGYFISNFAYIFVGLLLIFKKDKVAKVLGILSIVIGIFSGIYDASFKFNAQILDLLAMFSLVNFLLVFNLYKLKIINKLGALILALVFELIYLAGILSLEGSSGRIIFGLFVVGVILSEFVIFKKRLISNFKYFLIALITFLIGFGIWTLDASQLLCSPIEWLNGRAIYHYITAITIYYLYLHNRKK